MPVERKKFFEIDVPVMGTIINLYGKSIKEFDKRVIKIDLTRNLRGKSLEATFQVKVNGKAIAEPLRLLILQSYMRRMMRDAVSYVEDSFQTECIDAILRVKTFLITRKKVPRSVRKALREGARIALIESFKERIRDEIVADIVNNRMQRPLSLKLKKIYPLSLCEIRELTIIKYFPERTRIQKEPEKKTDLIDQVAELQIEPQSPATEGLDQMKEVEEELIKRAAQKDLELKSQEVKEPSPSIEGQPQSTTETQAKEKPKKRGKKKKKEEEGNTSKKDNEEKKETEVEVAEKKREGKKI